MTNIYPSNAHEYRRRIWAWTMYDWANSAFATTILAVILPVYFSQVAGATLPSAARATAYWSAGLSISLLIVAILSPILGTVSDVMRGKKRFLAAFASLGIVSTALLVLVSTGDWVLASILAILGRIGFNGSLTFYDALLPHVARPEDQDAVSARGYALGYLGGGLLLAINIAMIELIPGTWGARLSFLSVAIWWAIFSIPLFRRVPEPPASAASVASGKGIVAASFQRLTETLRGVRQYRQLFKFLIAFLIYNDGIGTIIGVAAIYGAEMGLKSSELIPALLLVQFVGIPYSLIFGRLPDQGDRRRPVYLAFVIFNLAALPLVGTLGARLLPIDSSGAPPAPFTTSGIYVGEGEYALGHTAIGLQGEWQTQAVSAKILGADQDAVYAASADPAARFDVTFNGQNIELTYGSGPDHGIWTVAIDGQPLTEAGKPVTVDAYNATVRYEEAEIFQAKSPGEHTLTVTDTGQRNANSHGSVITLGRVKVLPGIRQSNLGIIIGMILGLEALGLALSFVVGRALFSGLAHRLDTQRSILLSLIVYAVIAVWGFFLNSVIEFWFLAWMVAIVQGGSQALSRSLYAAMSPASKSGEFFGLFAVMEKFASLIGPLLFAAAGLWLGSSRPAVLSLIVLFIVGGFLLRQVNVAEGRRVAREEDQAFS
jgi:UMF1 family MFS transporter